MSEEQNIVTPEIAEEKDPSSLKLIFALGIAGLLSGIILVGTYIYTAPLIKANKAAAIQKAIFNRATCKWKEIRNRRADVKI